MERHQGRDRRRRGSPAAASGAPLSLAVGAGMKVAKRRLARSRQPLALHDTSPISPSSRKRTKTLSFPTALAPLVVALPDDLFDSLLKNSPSTAARASQSE